MKKSSIIILFILIGCASTGINPPHVNAVTITWKNATHSADGTTMTDFKGTKLYYGNQSGEYPNSIDVGMVTTYDLNLPDDHYCFTATHYDIAGNKSGFADEVCKDIDEYFGGKPIELKVIPKSK